VDDADGPRVMEDILGALGATPVLYDERLSCCGGSLVAFDEGGAAQLLRRKMTSMADAGADAVVVTCPSCFLQFDLRAKLVAEELRRPVFHLAEVMCLAFGVAARELRFKGWHAVKVDGALAGLGAGAEQEDLRAHFDVEDLARCCGACTLECTVVAGQADVPRRNSYDPLAVVRRVVAGEIGELLASPEIWYCLACHECTRRCPRTRGLAGMFETLRRLARARGITPPPVAARLEAVAQTGLTLQRQDWARDEFGLPPAAGPDPGAWAAILKARDDER